MHNSNKTCRNNINGMVSMRLSACFKFRNSSESFCTLFHIHFKRSVPLLHHLSNHSSIRPPTRQLSIIHPSQPSSTRLQNSRHRFGHRPNCSIDSTNPKFFCLWAPVRRTHQTSTLRTSITQSTSWTSLSLTLSPFLSSPLSISLPLYLSFSVCV